MYLAVTGNIGSGKTTLARLLSQHYNWNVIYEEIEDNPYLSDFYLDMRRWSFNLQVYFLSKRFNRLVDEIKKGQDFIQDRTIYEDAYIFASNLQAMNLMSNRDFENYFSVFNALNSFVKKPDILIYLKATVPVLFNHIESRGREYEQSININYLKSLNERYEDWIASYSGKIITIDVSSNHFNTKKEDLGDIISLIDSETNGLF